jgi:hypothetical protein
LSFSKNSLGVRSGQLNVDENEPSKFDTGRLSKPQQNELGVSTPLHPRGSTPVTPMSTAQLSRLATQPGNDLLVHDYSPSDSSKLLASQKLVNSRPKNYIFANAGPADYEPKKPRKTARGSLQVMSGPSIFCTYCGLLFTTYEHLERHLFTRTSLESIRESG